METRERDLLYQTANIVASHLSHNSVTHDQVPGLIRVVHTTLSGLNALGSVGFSSKELPIPAVPIKQSIKQDHIICLEDGKKLKMLRRYLMVAYNMTPAQYRQRWGLPANYPMVAPAYSQTRSDFAKSIGLGRRFENEEVVQVQLPIRQITEGKRGVGRPRKAA